MNSLRNDIRVDVVKSVDDMEEKLEFLKSNFRHVTDSLAHEIKEIKLDYDHMNIRTDQIIDDLQAQKKFVSKEFKIFTEWA